LCVTQFTATDGAVAKLKLTQYGHDDVVREFVKKVVDTDMDYGFARACTSGVDDALTKTAAKGWVVHLKVSAACAESQALKEVPLDPDASAACSFKSGKKRKPPARSWCSVVIRHRATCHRRRRRYCTRPSTILRTLVQPGSFERAQKQISHPVGPGQAI
jgi:hypothetical protein